MSDRSTVCQTDVAIQSNKALRMKLNTRAVLAATTTHTQHLTWRGLHQPELQLIHTHIPYRPKACSNQVKALTLADVESVWASVQPSVSPSRFLLKLAFSFRHHLKTNSTLMSSSTPLSLSLFLCLNVHFAEHHMVYMWSYIWSYNQCWIITKNSHHLIVLIQLILSNETKLGSCIGSYVQFLFLFSDEGDTNWMNFWKQTFIILIFLASFLFYKKKIF